MRQEDRRLKAQPTEQELYKTDLARSIKRERREGNLERLLEVQQQKKVWKVTFIFCLLLNLALLSMGIIGTYF